MKKWLSLFILLLVVFPGLSGLDLNEVRSEDRSSEVRMILPEKIYAVPGVETNVYFDNVVLVINPANYVFDVHCKIGHTQAERWTISPAEKEVGEYSFKLNVLDQNNEIIASQESKLVIVPKNSGEGQDISFLMIGDSLTQASVYTKQVLELSKNTTGLNLKLIGSHNPSKQAGNIHEGYGGWTAVRFATHFKETARTGHYKKRGSPFLYRDQPAEKPKLDFVRYCKEFNGGKSPEFVTIFLGPNDVYRCTDTNIEQTIDVVIKHLDILMGMIHQYSSETKIGMMLPVPASASQDAFGTTSGRGQTQWQYKRNQHRLVERMLEHYQPSTKVSVVPTHLNIDTVHNYPEREVLVNSRVSLKVKRRSNAVHPASSGYLQIGDSVFSWMKAQLVGKNAKK